MGACCHKDNKKKNPKQFQNKYESNQSQNEAQFIQQQK